MQRPLTIALFLLAVQFNSLSQGDDPWNLGHYNPDSLKKVLPALKDSARIDCLNYLSKSYQRVVDTDSAGIYARQALKEAEKIYYIKGLAEAYGILGRIEATLNADLLAYEKYCDKALQLWLKTSNEKEIAFAWGMLGYAKWIVGKFPESIEAYQKAVQYYEKVHDTAHLLIAFEQMSLTEREWGHKEKALEYAFKYQEVSKSEHYIILSGLYADVEDFETALEYLRKDTSWNMRYVGMGSIFYSKNQYDSSLYYYRLFSNDAKTAGEGDLSKFYAHFGTLQLALKKYDSAFLYLNTALMMHRKANDKNQLMAVLKALSRAYNEIGDNKRAMQMAQEYLLLASETGTRQHGRDAHFLLYELFEKQNNHDSAYDHLRQYTILNDSIDVDLSARKLAFYKTKSERERAQSKINVLNEEKKLHEQQLKQNAQEKNFLLAGIISLVLIGIITFRYILLKRKNEKNRHELAENELKIQKLESERNEAALLQQAADLEMKALRAQMNPHFIFNCLNSINGFILVNESETAADYLTKFSRLIRMVLNNSQKKYISLEDELETLHLYLYMESLRLKQDFHYEIRSDNNIEASSIFIPPLLLQPFVENAIWHGLVNKEHKGSLLIDLRFEYNILYCTITDNGVGRKKAAQLKSRSVEKNKSMGLQITKKRMELLNDDLTDQCTFEITDLEDEWGNATGTRVSLKIKVSGTGNEKFMEEMLQKRLDD